LGAKVSIQGAGAVGADLCRRLSEAGATVSLADVNHERAMAVAERTGAYVISPEDIHRLDADVFAPCALGASLNSATVAELAAPIVCGAANNQLAHPTIGAVLHRRGVLYCPDYVVNAGGIVAVQGEGAGDTVATVKAKVEAIPGRLTGILKTAERTVRPPEVVADEIACDRIGRGKRTSRDRRIALAAEAAVGR
jgi:leucine dehydrogenase